MPAKVLCEKMDELIAVVDGDMKELKVDGLRRGAIWMT